jgi:glutathione S-transferase
MKLYFFPGACSLAPHIALNEAGLSYTLDQLDRATKQTKSGKNYLTVNPKGMVPALELDDGQVLTELPAVIQYIADRKPEANIAPPAGTMARYRLQEWLTFIGTEIHKSFTPLFNPKMVDEGKTIYKAILNARFDYLAKALEGRNYLVGDAFTVADAYLFTVLNWTRYTGIDLGQWPVLKAYHERIFARPAVQAAMKEEGLIK